MKSTGRVSSPEGVGVFALALFAAFSLGAARAQNEPILVPEAVDYQKLLPVLPEPQSGWTADKPEGSTEDVGGWVCVTDLPDLVLPLCASPCPLLWQIEDHHRGRRATQRWKSTLRRA